MDVGTNQNGYRWLVDDQRELGKGYTARLWLDEQPTTTASRSGFSTREGAVSWASEFVGPSEEEQRRGLLIVAGFGVLFAVTFAAVIVRAFTGPTVIRIGGTRETTREVVRIVGPGRGGSGGRARPR